MRVLVHEATQNDSARIGRIVLSDEIMDDTCCEYDMRRGTEADNTFSGCPDKDAKWH